MSTPVITSKWAGNFDCTVCRRKRLMADEFSKTALEKYRKTGQPLRCKQCTTEQEQKERQQKQSAKETTTPNDNDETRKCAGLCNQTLPISSFNRNQWSKGDGKSRCRDCVEQSIQEELKQQEKQKDDKIEEARKKVEQLKLNKSTTTQRQIVQAESELSALEAEKVTGLKPIKLSGGRGRGGRGRGSRIGRGRGR